MNMSNYANFAYTIPNEEVEKLAPELSTSVFNTITELDLSLHEIRDYLEYGEKSCEDLDLLEAILYKLYYEIIQTTGMEISLHYHESEERGDDINGYYFIVDNAVIPNPNISTHSLIKPAYWVTYG